MLLFFFCEFWFHVPQLKGQKKVVLHSKIFIDLLKFDAIMNRLEKFQNVLF